VLPLSQAGAPATLIAELTTHYIFICIYLSIFLSICLYIYINTCKSNHICIPIVFWLVLRPLWSLGWPLYICISISIYQCLYIYPCIYIYVSNNTNITNNYCTPLCSGWRPGHIHRRVDHSLYIYMYISIYIPIHLCIHIYKYMEIW